MERIRGREQLLVRPTTDLPLLLITYPRGKESVARRLETLYTHRVRGLPAEIIAPYVETLRRLPVMIVVQLRPTNPCGCLGHHHPRGTESRLARRLAADFNSEVAEIDLAYDSIRDWRPQPLSSLAVEDHGDRFGLLHFEAALLAVMLHELHHMAFPEAVEREVREKSNQLYTNLLKQSVGEESGHEYGMLG